MMGDKAYSIKTWPRPCNKGQMRSFLGLANYYRRFVKSFACIARPLTAYTRLDAPEVWTEACETAFNELKDALAHAPVLQMADFEKPFVVETDASKFALGAVLGQVQEPGGKPMPVCYLSRSLNSAERNYDAFDRECLAVVAACKQWRPYLEGSRHRFTLFTDNKALEQMFERMDAKDPYGRRARWIELLSRYQFTAKHRAGVSNVAADALSRRPDYEGWGETRVGNSGRLGNATILVEPPRSAMK